jgi:hypothetical protein
VQWRGGRSGAGEEDGAITHTTCSEFAKTPVVSPSLSGRPYLGRKKLQNPAPPGHPPGAGMRALIVLAAALPGGGGLSPRVAHGALRPPGAESKLGSVRQCAPHLDRRQILFITMGYPDCLLNDTARLPKSTGERRVLQAFAHGAAANGFEVEVVNVPSYCEAFSEVGLRSCNERNESQERVAMMRAVHDYGFHALNALTLAALHAGKADEAHRIVLDEWFQPFWCAAQTRVEQQRQRPLGHTSATADRAKWYCLPAVMISRCSATRP